MANREPHAVVFPFPTQGHINPLSLLAKRLLNGGINVTFVHTARTFRMLQQRNQIELSRKDSEDPGNYASCKGAKLRMEVLPDEVSTDDASAPVSPSVVLFISSIPLLRVHLQCFLQRLLDEGRPASCIISDTFLPWTQDVANSFNIPRIEFWSSTAMVYSMGFSIPNLLRHGYLPVPSGTDLETTIDIVPGVGPCRHADFFYDLLHDSGASPRFKFFQDAFSRGKESQRVLIHSMQHLEDNVIQALREEGIPVDPIGPLLESFVDGSASSTHEHYTELNSVSLLDEDTSCLEWLNTHPKTSVIYVSFGSNVKIHVEEIQELAFGLEDSQQPFLLVIRPDLLDNKSLSDILPDNFIERNRGRAWVSFWAPQRAILLHPSVGGFLTHCGWNSILESMWTGVPLIGCPRESEQNTNLKCLLDWKCAISIDLKQPKVILKRELVKTAISTLFNEPEGELVRSRMTELKTAARNTIEKGQSRFNLEKLIDDIKKMASGDRPRFLPA
ncbi:hypothetical protein KP509_38G058600 [Ceratopteris richardii]|uniref:Glycosyltransferase n=1 Tax=Ceratopteris richardii TaxID=49495 RepID=A0A8T2Q561_CERRI|nr:hypothetical protein KP509_38G058600 [Ceratopteris richardii]